MERVEWLAMVSVARACAFAGLAIFCFMIGLVGYLVVALKTGATLSLAVAACLTELARRAPRRRYQRTEVWLMLEATERPRSEVAQQVIGRALRAAFLRFAGHFALIGAVLFLFAMVVQLTLTPIPSL